MSFLLAFIWFKVQGSRVWWRLRRLFYWAMPESDIQVTSHSYDTREGIVSHVWHEILRLSPHLFWLGLFSHRAFLSAQDDDTGERLVSRGGGFAAFLEDGILASQPSPLGEGAPQGRIGHRRHERG